MTTNEARQLLPIIQAYAEGKPLQIKTGGAWHDRSGDVNFCLPASCYRIKPDRWAKEREAYAQGKTIQCRFPHSERWDDCNDPPLFAHDIEYRIKPEFLTREELLKLCGGKEPHREDGWRHEWLTDGWRPLLKGDSPKVGDELRGDWPESSWSAFNRDRSPEVGICAEMFFYRTRRPLPAEPKLVALGRDDVRPGTVFRPKDDPDGYDTPASVNGAGVVLANRLGKRFTWEKLMSDWEMLPFGQTEWQPCSKPA